MPEAPPVTTTFFPLNDISALPSKGLARKLDVDFARGKQSAVLIGHSYIEPDERRTPHRLLLSLGDIRVEARHVAFVSRTPERGVGIADETIVPCPVRHVVRDPRAHRRAIPVRAR